MLQAKRKLKGRCVAVTSWHFKELFPSKKCRCLVHYHYRTMWQGISDAHTLAPSRLDGRRYVVQLWTKDPRKDQKKPGAYTVRPCIPHWFSVVKIERRGRVDNISASYFGGPRFKSRPGDRLSWLRFSRFNSVPPLKCRDIALKLYHYGFIPRPSRFIIHVSYFH
jgi:hypothetical protein